MHVIGKRGGGRSALYAVACALAMAAGPASLGAAPWGPGSAAYRADLDRAVRKHDGARHVPLAALGDMARLHHVSWMRVRTDLLAAECHEIRRAEVPADPMAPVFEGVCSNCHSPTGVGDGEMAQLFQVPVERMNLVGGRSRTWPMEAVAQVIRDGRGEMPPYGDALTGEQIRGLVGFLRRIENACARVRTGER